MILVASASLDGMVEFAALVDKIVGAEAVTVDRTVQAEISVP